MNPEGFPRTLRVARPEKTPEQIERESLITANIAKAGEIAALQEKIRRQEHLVNHLEKRSALLTQVQVITMTTPVGEASSLEMTEAFEEISNLLLDVR